MATRHAGFDRAAQDNTMRYERPRFTVTGEGSKSALLRYSENYALINWRA